MAKQRTIEQDGVHCVIEEGVLVAVLRRDPVSKKHLVYLTKEATCTDIADLIKTDVIVKND